MKPAAAPARRLVDDREGSHSLNAQKREAPRLSDVPSLPPGEEITTLLRRRHPNAVPFSKYGNAKYTTRTSQRQLVGPSSASCSASFLSGREPRAPWTTIR
jgi:hypothetical protein